MKFLLLSDLHLEFGWFFIPEMENEKETVVVLAGDIGIVAKEHTYRDFINDTCKRFKHVIWILGNHEHYHGKFPTTYAKIWNATLDYDNIDIAEKETIIIDDVAFICATMWTSFDNNNIMTMQQAELWMNDYKNIRTGPESEPWKMKFRPLDALSDHHRAIEFLFPEIKKQKDAGNKTVVVTHHLPSFMSIHEQYRGNDMNGAYASELFEHIMEAQPNVWCHGHTHASSDYMIGGTRILCNPRGYKGYELNPDFNDTLVIEV